VQVLEGYDSSAVAALCGRDEFFWLDMTGPPAEAIDELAERFHWHPLVVEDLTEFSQRPKMERYGDYVFIVFYGARSDEEASTALTEVHLVVSGSYVVTVRHTGCQELHDVRARFGEHGAESEQFVVYRVLDALTDSFFPVLERIDDEIDSLEDRIVENPGDEELREVSRVKRRLIEMRRVVTPQRDLAARALSEIGDLPGLDPDKHDYYRDLYDHLIRISDLIDSYRDLLTSVMDVYLSTVSNRLNVVMKQLTVIATVFLPLTFVTGFFGQNFAWMVGHIGSFADFMVFGVGGCALAVVALYAIFKTRGWLD
jgi:magnesium transporter